MQGNFGSGRFGGGGFESRGPRKPVPVKEGETYEVVVEGVGSKGDGIAKYQGFVIVVPGVQKGEKIKVRVDAVRGRLSFGTVVEKLGTVEIAEGPKEAAAEASEETAEEGPEEEPEEMTDE